MGVGRAEAALPSRCEEDSALQGRKGSKRFFLGGVLCPTELPLDPVPISPGADAILKAADAYILAPAIASVEGCDEVTSMVLRTMGSGVGNSSGSPTPRRWTRKLRGSRRTPRRSSRPTCLACGPFLYLQDSILLGDAILE